MRLFFRGRKKRTSARPRLWLCRLTAVILLPVLFSAFLAAGGVLRHAVGKPVPFWPALAGAVAYLVFQVVFRRPMTVYVFGHESTHALAAWISGYRVKSFSASSRGGEVILSGTNTWVALAPYCIPLYTVVAMTILAGVKHIGHFSVPAFWWSFTVGATFAFHVALTVYALHQQQPDLHYVGSFLSIVLILLANGCIFVLVLKALFPSWISLKFFVAQWAGHLFVSLDFLTQWILRGARFLILTVKNT